MEIIRGNTLEYWKKNAEEDYLKVPISVLKYITILEEQNQALRQYGVMQLSEQLCGFFEADNKTSSATICKCGREKWEHPKAT